MLHSEQSNSQVLSVSQLNARVKQLLEVSFGRVRIAGELSSFTRASSGHWYFDLKDEQSQVRCAMFKSQSARVKFSPKEGDFVQLQAQVSLYSQRGAYQLIVQSMQETGEGALWQAFVELKQKLQQQGLFDAKHKRPITAVSKVGLVTSATGAALQDILTVLQRRCPLIDVFIYPTAVQGKGASEQIIAAIELANQQHKVDALIVGRGGGSIEDLWCFNDEALAQAIFASKLPIISAVGHATDTSISDLVADLCAPTPSAAAELISPDWQIWQRDLSSARSQLMQAMVQQIAQKRERMQHLMARLRHPKQRLHSLMQHNDQLTLRLHQAMLKRLKQSKHQWALLQHELLLQQPKERLLRQRNQLQLLLVRLKQSMQKIKHNKRNQLAQQANLLQSLSPLNVMARGYALALDKEHNALTSVKQIAVEQTLYVRLQDGEITANVQAVHPSATDIKQ